MKKLLTLVAVGTLLSGSAFAQAMNEAHIPSTDSTAIVKPLKDGGKLEIGAGHSAMLVNSDGTKATAPDGTYESTDGTTLTVKDGNLSH